MGEGNAAIQSGGRASYSGDGGSVMTHTAGSVTTRSIALKYVMAFEPYRNTWYLKQVVGGLPYIKISFFLNTYSIESKMFLKLAWIVLDSGQNFSHGIQKTGFFTKMIFCSIIFQSQCMALWPRGV